MLVITAHISSYSFNWYG